MAVIYLISDNIISSLGNTTAENFEAVASGCSGVKSYPENTLGVPEAFSASMVDDSKLNHDVFSKQNTVNLSRFEKLGILSVANALTSAGINPASSRTIFILSTTKGNVELLEQDGDKYNHDKLYLWHSANCISQFFNNPNQPVVVSNACISGVSAQIAAKRLLLTGSFDFAVVVGVDVLSKFVISGFQSFKALSPVTCRPFDENRIGLNLGEAAATMIYGIASSLNDLPQNAVILEAGFVTNDANHISGPSRTGEGLFLALRAVLQNCQSQDIDFISAHGTATPYNDEMESIAITRAGLEKAPVNSLKGYFGHTLGAAGILETIISSESLRKNKLIKSYGYETNGVSNPLNIILETSKSNCNRFIKTISGFGGCNAAIMIKKTGGEK